MMPAVAFRDVSFRYPDARDWTLRSVALEIPEGAFTLIAGATGAGKSTLLRAMNGLVPHFTGGRWDGRVEVLGRDTLEFAPRELADVAAFVPQDPGAAFVVDRVEDELAYAMENLAVAPEVMRRRVEETLDLMDIDSLRDRSVRTLSGGQRQRVAIAAALTVRPRVLLLDEPTSQLDPQGAEDVLAALQRLVHDLGITVVVAEHRLERVAGFVDAAVGIRAGEVRTGEVLDVLEFVEAGPPVTRLGRMLGWRPPPITVREARRVAPSLPPAPLTSKAHDRKTGVELVETSRLSAAYGPRDVLHDIDLDLEGGEIVAMMGRNGAGKTTLLRCLCGLHAPSRGRVTVGGDAPVAGRDVALCPQSPETLLFRETTREEVQTTLDASHIEAAPESILEELGIASFAQRHPRDLSAGERLLVAVAAIVATGAPVLLLDEPTRGLDPESKKLLAMMMHRYAGNRRAVVFATHDVELVAAVATRVLMLAGGELIADGTPAEVLSDSPVFAPQMARVFGAGWLTPEQVVAAVGS